MKKILTIAFLQTEFEQGLELLGFNDLLGQHRLDKQAMLVSVIFKFFEIELAHNDS